MDMAAGREEGQCRSKKGENRCISEENKGMVG